MNQRPLRILLLDDDNSIAHSLRTALGPAAHIESQVDPSPESLMLLARDVDVIVASTRRGSWDPLRVVRNVRGAGIESRTIVVSDDLGDDPCSEIVSLGIAGFVRRDSAPLHLANTVIHISEGGAAFDAPAAAALQRGSGASREAAGSVMKAARALASALELKDTYTGGHAERVTSMALRLAAAAGDGDVLIDEALEASFLLHDVGKIGIPESILNKPSGLSDTERRVLNTHPILGERIVAPLGFPKVVAQVIRHHHERWDGAGYPDRLAGEDIPKEARIFAIADVIDAMTSIRPYRRPISLEAAVEQVALAKGTHFDPDLAELAHETFLGGMVDVSESR